MLGVGGDFEDGGSSPVDSVVIDALQRGQWTPGDLLSSLYHSAGVWGPKQKCCRTTRWYRWSRCSQQCTIILCHYRDMKSWWYFLARLKAVLRYQWRTNAEQSSSRQQETAGETTPVGGCRPWWYQPQDREDMCQPAISCPTTPLQPEPGSGENTSALEDVLPSSCAKEVKTIGPQWLAPSGPHVLRDEGAGEIGLGQPEAAGKSPAGPSAIC